MEGLAISESKLDGDRDRKVPLLICQIIIIITIVIIFSLLSTLCIYIAV